MNTLMHTENLDDGVLHIILNRPNSAANILDLPFFEELNELLQSIEDNNEIKAVIFSSDKPAIFIAGADLNTFSQDMTENKIRMLIKTGQDTFNRIHNLNAVSISAIHGVCVGGGLELALACDYRLASNHKVTKLGLPEVNLGILPAWGGSTRMPRLIGIQAALGLILSGKQIPSKKALKIGLIDGMVPSENLLAGSLSYISKGKRTIEGHPIKHHAVTLEIVRNQAKKQVLKKTKGLYPAPLEALDVATRGLTVSEEKSYKMEEDAFVKLAEGPVSQSLIHLFFLQERSKKAKVVIDPKEVSRIDNAAVIGAGVMGSGIAQWVSSRKYPIVLKDINPDQLSKGMAHARKLYKDGTKRRVFTKTEAQSGLDNITPVTGDFTTRKNGIVIEAIVEKIDLKQKVLSELEKTLPKDCIIASNTSAISISEIGKALQDPSRMIGLHFFNPVHRMKLVEIIRGEDTSDETTTKTLEFTKKIGKLPVLVKDSPGFLVNRILMPYLFESIRLFEEGYDTEDIDKAMLEFGMPMGPLRLIDEVGLDVAQHVADDLIQRLANPFSQTDVLQQMMQKELMGKKSNSGFYVYKKKDSVVNTELENLQKDQLTVAGKRKDLVRKMVYLMINEGARCLEEGVIEAPHDVDFGMVMGTGFAPFRGGPLRFADSSGIAKIVDHLKRFADESGVHFQPCDLLLEMAKKNKCFYSNSPSILPHQPNDHSDHHKSAA